MNKHDRTKVIYQAGPLGWIFFMAYIGAFIHFFSTSPNFLGFVIAIFKAAVWPAYVVYEVLGVLGVR